MIKNKYINSNIIDKFREIEININNGNLSEKEFFKIIGILDKKFSNDNFYKINIEGFIGNAGISLKSQKILSYGIKRIKKTIEKSKHICHDKLYYDLGNIIMSKAYLNKTGNTIESLVNSNEYFEAKHYFDMVKNNSYPEQYFMANTNSSNILDTYGRFYESVFLYNKILDICPNFGMALGNKAESILNYYNLLPDSLKIPELLILSHKLLKEALEDDKLIEIGGDFAKLNFEKRFLSIDRFIRKNKINSRQISLTKNNINNNFKKFILEKNLYLNNHFGFFICENCSLKDNLFPSFIDKKQNLSSNENYGIYGKKVYYSIKLYNQIIEDFSTSRYLYFLSAKNQFNSFDEITTYISDLNYSKNSINYGLIKNYICKTL